ncbi:Midasin [Oopsacas minuta]|uniref:Midasin n=1 Tax=Oopsacas minuta TaxID=111878 RepID=A0AAV7K1E5_9METZ|nr:Midasin [Oopsacas minuta]
MTTVFQYLSQYETLVGEDSLKNTLILILNVLTELVTKEPRMFKKLNLSCFLSLGTLRYSEIKWRVIKLFSIIFQLDIEQSTKFYNEKGLKAALPDINEACTEYGQVEISPQQMNFLKKFTASFSHWVEVQGVILPKIRTKSSHYFPPTNLIMVPTTQLALKSIAFSIAQTTPILIRGEIGVGKTMLISHLSNVIGNNTDLVTVQLSDQTDSKSLIGSYTSTEKPGEFVWKPGVLVHAMQTGKWLLLEDIDYAGKDVISTLLPILENNILPIPGMSETVTANIGFQIFATQRTNANGQPLFSSEASLLEKYWNVVQVNYPTVEELETIISKKYPNLSSTASKLIQIFQSTSVENTQTEFLKRKITLRDLMKWCKRTENFVDGLEAINLEGIFLEALDCFVVAFLSKNIQHSLANQLGNQLGLNQTKIEYYLTNYKPSISFSVANFSIGRALIPLNQFTGLIEAPITTMPFAYTQQTSMLLERLAVCVQYKEPILLVGETGTGKTSTVQHLANQTNNKLVVINMSRQSDTIDLLGGYKPIGVDYIMLPLKKMFLDCFENSFSKSKNKVFIGHIETICSQKKWDTLISMMEHVRKSASIKENLSTKSSESWKIFGKELTSASENLNKMKSSFTFRFMEGALVKAIRNGWWVLLDEINLACPEVLECLNGILDQSTDSILLADTYTNVPITKNGDFHIFACMNPALDIGKKRLPQGIENRFTEIFLHELTQTQDLRLLVFDYLQTMTISGELVNSIVDFYLQVLALANDKLVDGSGHKPHFSLRTLCRALKYSATNPCRHFNHSIYEGICLSFLTQLNRESYTLVEKLAQKLIIKDSLSILKQKIPKPKDDHNYTNILGYWIRKGNLEIKSLESYVITPAIAKNLKDIARIASARQYPILLQGPTSSGKTSLIQWLATNTGNKVYRINNHEHTDLQEYIGSYIPDKDGKLCFQEGLLPRAMRNGDWVILDELNLAPSDVLEALNRVLDDNRELFITETQTTIRAHSNFILFATQNPPGLYGGRKLLSRAFRNRFIELHFVEIPTPELIDILHQRCAIPRSYCKKMIDVMKELQLQRKLTGLFAGKHGYITLRDLFKWAERYRGTEAIPAKFRDWDQLLIEDGYLLLAGKLRHPEEISIVAQVLEKHFRRTINEEQLFYLNLPNPVNNILQYSQAILQGGVIGMEHIYPTRAFSRLLIHISRALHFNEPILLVGPTGSGKTTACQLISILHQKKLQYINCHMHTETADFIGSLRPVRTPEAIQAGRLFEWMDGPLVQAVKNGEYMLLDEISLADDAVLERMNSLLEPERSLVIAEKGGDSVELIASQGFILFGTMNPGGDFGKKELSPALRNRFTEIWCPDTDTIEDTISLLNHNLHLEKTLAKEISLKMVTFVQWFHTQPNSSNFPLSKRDILCWVEFMNICLNEESKTSNTSPWLSFIEGAHLVLLDGLGVGLSTVLDASSESVSIEYLHSLIPEEINHTQGLNGNDISQCQFAIKMGPNQQISDPTYSLTTPTVSRNAYRILRALQLPKPILLEGIPGVGKSSIVMALARYYGYELVRINLSEQTDISDLFGADLPSDSGNAGEFEWRDGPLLHALKDGVWVLLDELNLASQSVLEGLNSCFDHRHEIYISELDRTFRIQTDSTRIFATQNPMSQGGGRKGLPKSFLNRFTKVYMQSLHATDFLFICRQAFSEIDQHILKLMITFNQVIDASVNQDRLFGNLGSPFEFNLRDLFRWCKLMVTKSNGVLPYFNQPSMFIRVIYSDRLRTASDKERVFQIFKYVFQEFPEMTKTNAFVYDIVATAKSIQIGHVVLDRKCEHKIDINQHDLSILPYQLPYLESVMFCVKQSWLPILVGGVGTGKSSLVRLLAKLTGNTLNEFSVNSAMDSYELVGGFHQVGLSRQVKVCLDKLQNELAGYLTTNFNHILAKEIYLHYHFLSNYSLQNENKLQDSIEIILRKITSLLHYYSIPAKIRSSLRHVTSKLQSIQDSLQTNSQTTNQFAWIDSPLVLAAKRGHWLLIDNVNLCSPSVLDRLNALLEPNGTLVLHEKGIINDICEEITPHKDFRIFFCMDQKLGELSRAMRNRGIEICISEISKHQDCSPVTDLKYGLLDMKYAEKRDNLGKILGISHYQGDILEHEEIMQTDACTSTIERNKWRNVNFLTNNPILSNVLSESEIFNQSTTENTEDFQKNLSILFVLLSTQSDISHREDIINQFVLIYPYTHNIIQFISKNRLHELITDKFAITQIDPQHLPLDISYRDMFCRSLNQKMLYRVMNEVEKIYLRINVHIIQLYVKNFQGTGESLYEQSQDFVENKHSSENMEIKSIKYFYPFVSKILTLLVEEFFWNIHHHSNWDAINRSIIWLQNFIEYIISGNERSKENTTIVWYLLSKNFLQFLGQKGIHWEKIPKIYPLINQIEEDLNTSMIDSPLVRVLEAFPRPLPLSTVEAVNCAVSLQSLLEVIVHIPDISKDIIRQISQIRSNLFSCSLDLSNSQTVEYRNVQQTISELNQKIRLPNDKISNESPLRKAQQEYFYSSIVYICSICKYYNLEEAIINNSLTRLFEHANSYTVVDINVLSLLSPTICSQGGRMRENLIFFQELFITSVTHNIQLLLSETTPNAEIFSFLFNIVESFGNNSKSVTEQQNNKIGIKLNNFEDKGEELREMIDHFACVSFTHFIGDPSNFENIFLAALIEICKAFNAIILPKNHIQLFNIEDKNEILTLAKRLLSNISEILINEQENKENYQTFISNFKQSILSFDNWIETNDITHQYNSMIFLGITMVNILAPHTPLDPVVINQRELECLNRELNNLNSNLRANNLYYRVCFGITEVGLRKQTPLPIERLERRILNLNNEIDNIKKRLAIRPTHSQYQEIYYTCRKIQQTLCDATKIRDLIQQLEGEPPQNIIQRLSTHINSISRTIINLQRKYLAYPDVITPFAFSLSILLYGLHSRIQKNIISIPIDFIQRKLITFSNYDELSPTNIDRITNILNSEIFLKISSNFREKICRLVLLWILELKSLKPYSLDILERLFYKILDLYSEEWNKYIEREKQKAIEKDSLYKYKEVEHCSDSSEEIIEKDFKEKFPDYYDRFSDVENTETNISADTSKSLKPNLDENIWSFTEETYTILTNSHSYFHTGNFLIQNSKFNNQSQISGIFLQERILQQYNTTHGMSTNLKGDYNLHIAIADICLKSFTQNLTTEIYDFYIDPNPSELQQVKPALITFKTRIYQLLEEWPDHSVLNQLIVVADRILSLSITSPIMQILTGLQILITKAQDWEAYAAKHVSIQEELGHISELVIRYRKMELVGWPKVLEASKRKYEMKSTKLFMHIYQIINAYFSVEKIENFENIENIANLLKQFIESSTLGNFEMKLNLLGNFKFSFKSANAIFHTLTSLHSFYSQFLQSVKNRLETQCTPVVKELKEFVSISKWNDINYWRLKETVEKSHRTIHKHIRKYEEVLNQPIHELLTISTFNLQKFPVLPPNNCLKEMKVKIVQTLRENSPVDISHILKECQQSNVVLPKRTDKIGAKLLKYMLKYSRDDKQLQEMEEIRNLTTEIRDNMNEIISETKESLSPAEKEEMKQQKFLCMKKQRLLSELFKLLRSFGFSNRFASTGGKTLLDTIDFASIHTLLPSPNLLISTNTCVQHIDRVFFDNLKLITSLDMSLHKPHKQLTPYLVESLRAYSIDMLHCIITHRQHILQLAQSINDISNMLVRSSDHTNISTPQSHLLLPTQVYCFVGKLRCIIQGLLEQLRECSYLLTRINKTQNGTFPLEDSLLPRIIADSMVAVNIRELLDNTYNDVDILLHDLATLQTCILFQWNDFTVLKHKYNILSNLLKILTCELTKALTSKATGNIEYGFFHGLFKIHSKFEQTLEQFLSIQHQLENIRVETTVSEHPIKMLFTSRIFQIILTSVQTLTNINTSDQTVSLEKLGLTNSSRNPDLCLKNLLLDNVEFEICKQGRIFRLLDKTVLNLKSNLDELGSCTGEKLQMQTLSFLQLQSVLRSYLLLCETVFLKHVEIQYNSNELLQTILSIFNLVSAKGFCAPEAVIEEMAKEGETILQEFEGGGFGDGEGATNVSEQIDNQEQVEGLQNEESKNENEGEIKEEKGVEMSEDFEGGMGDKASGQDDEGNSEGSNVDDLDKRIGEVDDKQGQMNEEMWGESSDDEGEVKGNQEGGNQSKDEKIVAKGESVKNSDSQKENRKDGIEDTAVDQLQDKLNDNLDLDEQLPGETTDNEQQGQLPEPLDISDDLNLDGIEREDSIEQCIESSDQDSGDDMEVDDSIQDPLETMDNESEQDFDLKTMDKLEGNESNNESEPDTNQNDPRPFDTTEHTGDPQTAVQSSSKYGTGTNGQMDENTQNEEAFDNFGSINDREVTETHDGGESNRNESGTSDENKLKSKLSRSNENRQLAEEGEKPQLKKQKILNEDMLDNNNNKQNKPQDNEQISNLYKHKTKDSDRHQSDTTALDSATNEQAKTQPQTGTSESYDLDSNEESNDNLDSNKVQLERDAELSMDTRVTSENKFITQDDDRESKDDSYTSEIMDEDNTTRNLVSLFATNEQYIHPTVHTMQTELPIVELENIEQLQIASETQKLWLETDREVSHLSRDLCEQLRLILQPQQASKLKGDYRTGKRLNMRKIIPYIASQFRNDKIWLRRTQPNKRQYQIMLAIDDSKSMAIYKSKTIAFQTFALLGNALTWLDVGQLGVCKFGKTTDVILPLGIPFTQERAYQALQQLSMEQMKTKIAQMLRKITPLMVQNRTYVHTPFSGSINQLMIIISDGRGIFLEGKDIVEKAVRQTMDNGIFVIFIILDSPDNKDSIVDIKVPVFSQTNTLPQFKSYLEIFPFPFYIVLRDIQTLPETSQNMLETLYHTTKQQINSSSIRNLLTISVIIRAALILYGRLHDTIFRVKYTDIDYTVFSEAAQHVCDGASPYERETYRYTPLLAWILIPNCYFAIYGKILFSILDILAGYLIYVSIDGKKHGEYSRKLATCFWLFNPLNIVVCTRGNAESIVCILVLLVLACLKSGWIKLSAIVYGLAVHFKVYPIVYALPLYLYCGYIGKKNTGVVWFNLKGIKFGIISGSVFLTLAFGFYLIYGDEFLSETYFYHITRTDTKHNFSPYFYMLHLSQHSSLLPLIGALVFIPQFVLIIFTGYSFCRQLELAVFLQTAVFATYNKVVTSQYFLWYLSILPLIIPYSTLSFKTATKMFSMWIIAQLLWLFPAYLYEFEGYSTYPLLWLAGLLFFSVNVYNILVIIKHHNITYEYP